MCPRPGTREWAEENLQIMTKDEFPLLCSEEALSLLMAVGCASAPSKGAPVQPEFGWYWEELDGVRGWAGDMT